MNAPRAVETFKQGAPATYAEASTGQNARISTGWLSEFGDARMTQVVNEALKQNLDL